jgi:protein SCO1/2
MLKNRPTFLALLVTACAIVQACQPYQFHGTLLEPPKTLTDFTLQRADGGEYRLSEAGDRVLVLFFGYTHCPDVCPTTLYELSETMEALGDEADRVQVAFVTVDPERDTPEQLTAYVRNMHPSFIGLRAADSESLAVIAAEFGVFYEAEPSLDSGESYLVTHTSAVFVVQHLNLRLLFSYGTPGEDIAADLRQLLREP